MKTTARSTIATLICLCFSVVLAGSASAQSDNASVTVSSFTKVEVKNKTAPAFNVGEEEFDSSVSLSGDGSTSDYGTVEATNPNSSERNISVKGLSNAGGFDIGVEVLSSSDTGVESVTFEVLDSFSGSNTNVLAGGPTFTVTKGSTTNLVERTNRGAVQFGINYDKVSLDGQNVSTGTVNVNIDYTISGK